MDFKALTGIFLSESEELITEFEQGLITLEDRPSDDEAVHRIFRSAHTLKSNAGMLGIDAIVQLAHAAESVLSLVRDRTLAIEPKLITMLRQFIDCFRTMVANVAAGTPVVLDEAGQAVLVGLDELLVPQNKRPEPKTSSLPISPHRNDLYARSLQDGAGPCLPDCRFSRCRRIPL